MIKKEEIRTQVEETGGYGLDPADLLARLRRPGEPAFLFESVDEETRKPAFTFLGVWPREIYRSESGRLYVRRRAARSAKLGKEVALKGNPADLLERVSSGFFRAADANLPPFAGGFVGCLGFEFIRYAEPVLEKYLRKPAADAEFMLIGTVIVFDHRRESIRLIGNLFPERESKSDGFARIEREFRKIRTAIGRAGADARTTAKPRRSVKAAKVRLKLKPGFGPAAFGGAVRAIKEKIRAGDLFQCVISERFEFSLRIDPLRVFGALKRVSPSPYHFYVDFGSSVLLGASPERLVSIEGDLVETHPIAGTRPRGATRATDARFERQLLASVKERAEHAMLVDLGRNDLGRISRPGTVTVERYMQVRRFSHVMHLVSTVCGRLEPAVTPFRALLACFPAGTLSGAPKISALKSIATLERNARGAYGGAFVLQDFSGRLDSCIVIRSLGVREGRAWLQAGAGIVADSNAKREYDEVKNKIRAVVKAIEVALREGSA